MCGGDAGNGHSLDTSVVVVTRNTTRREHNTQHNDSHGRRLAMGAGGEHKREKEGTSQMRGNESRLGEGGVVVTGRSASAASSEGKNANTSVCRRSLCVNARARQVVTGSLCIPPQPVTTC